MPALQVERADHSERGRLRVLTLHSRYRSGPVSGENRVVQDEAALLRSAGHEVRVWTPVPTAKTRSELVKTAAGMIWSPSATAEIARLADRFRPDIVHFHNLFPLLSPAALRAATKRARAVVMTLHNYRLMCLPATLLRDGKLCELCVGKVPVHGVVHRCYQNSAAASGVMATSLAMHRRLGSFDSISLFLAVSAFVRDKYIAAGVAPERIVVKPNFADETARRQGPGDYFIYVGRLAPEKGVALLMEIWRRVGRKLLVVGEGPEEARLKAIAPPGVEFLGTVPGEEVPRLLSGARAVLLPSIWYEAAPRVVIEAYAAGVPVIASGIGGLVDLVPDGESGCIVRPGDADAWAATIERLLDDRESERLGKGAWERWRARYAPDHGIKQLEAAYSAALDRAGAANPDRAAQARHVPESAS